MKTNLVYLLTFVVSVTASAIPGPNAVDSAVSDKHLLVRDDGICHSSIDCEGGLCWEGICIDSRCRNSGDCPDDYYCLRGNCNPIPGRERDVDATQMLTERNDPKCHSMEDCRGALCIRGVCTDSHCRHNGDCPNDYFCFRGDCNPIPGRARDVKPYISDKHLLARDDGICHSSTDCEGGLCWEGICIDSRCRNSGDCPDDYYCFRGNCNPIPGRERDVSADQIDQSDDTVDIEMCPINVTDTGLEAPPTPCKHDKDCKRCMHCIKGHCGYRHGKAEDESELMGSDGN
ncbi:uncharacterized protein BDW47DRAFT_128679 [Aspergillus candidus]|uniref:Dickkopf N-terminal cysteine-rich domain-containing protein n=1 Tax=Aspergillus candidus TaxID=41067 RepID=A0A2I2F2P4_ASPCN|nr:hypothetical protein BDW47DRAFT_128679 [Aspergillus candidus]PLB34879.1 hypothetical protein BDW47DRAFT_128679 [Aspergillus candidus]